MDEDDDHSFTNKMLKKRKRQYKYGTALEYIAREKPGSLPHLYPNWTNNKKILKKTFRKLASYRGKTFT